MHNNENVKCISHVASCSLERDLEVDNRQRIHQLKSTIKSRTVLWKGRSR